MKTLRHPTETLADLEELFAATRHTRFSKARDTTAYLPFYRCYIWSYARHVHKYSVVFALSGLTIATL